MIRRLLHAKLGVFSFASNWDISVHTNSYDQIEPAIAVEREHL